MRKEVIKEKDEYSSPNLVLTGVVRQNGDFPLKKYGVQARFKVTFDKHVIGTAYSEGDVVMQDGTAVFSAKVSLYTASKEEREKINPDGSPLVVSLEKFSWYPLRDDLAKATLIQ